MNLSTELSIKYATMAADDLLNAVQLLRLLSDCSDQLTKDKQAMVRRDAAVRMASATRFTIIAMAFADKAVL